MLSLHVCGKEFGFSTFRIFTVLLYRLVVSNKTFGLSTNNVTRVFLLCVYLSYHMLSDVITRHLLLGTDTR